MPRQERPKSAAVPQYVIRLQGSVICLSCFPLLGVVNDKLLIAAACFSYLRTECYILRFFPTGVDVKVTPSWDTLFVCGILCNVLVCLAVRIGFAARSVSDKVLGILLPIAGFVAMGFEHCVANMFFLPMGLVAKTFGFGADAAGVAALDVSGILYNLSAATLGNILGGPVRGAGLLVPQRQTARKGRWRNRLIDAIHSSPSLVILVLQGGAI